MRCVFALCCFLTITLVSISGCGGGRPSLVPAVGTVTLNGEPLEGARVGLMPVGIEGYERPSTATTDAQGNFTIGTYGKNDGVPQGTYTVTVVKKELASKLPKDFNSEDLTDAGPVKYKWITPMLYGDPESSGLTVEITSDGMSPDQIALTGEPEMEIVGGKSANEP
ncbi:MAG: carboxypeptidase-like regulatory domain-containing protein [Planctomycetaceae bacterium]